MQRTALRAADDHPISSSSSPTGGRARSTATATAEQSTLISHKGRFANKSSSRLSKLPNPTGIRPTGICTEVTIDAREPIAGRERPKRLQYVGPSEHRSREDPPSVSLQPVMRGVDVVSDERLQNAENEEIT